MAGNGRNGRAWCRSCGYFEWADSDNHRPTPEQIQTANEERARLANEQRERTRVKVAKLQAAAYWQGWHDHMTEQQRNLWRNEGIPDVLQDMFRLGAVGDMEFTDGDNRFHSPAMTIPIFDVGWKAVNVQYRLTTPPQGVGKYRFTPGLPAPLFLTDPDKEPRNATILVEGAKKAIITYLHLGHKYTVVAVPSKTPPQSLVDRLRECDPVYIALDPDAYTGQRTKDGRVMQPAVNRIAKMLKGRARIVKLPCKPDDLLTIYGGNAADLSRFLAVAARA